MNFKTKYKTFIGVVHSVFYFSCWWPNMEIFWLLIYQVPIWVISGNHHTNSSGAHNLKYVKINFDLIFILMI